MKRRNWEEQVDEAIKRERAKIERAFAAVLSEIDRVERRLARPPTKRKARAKLRGKKP